MRSEHARSIFRNIRSGPFRGPCGSRLERARGCGNRGGRMIQDQASFTTRLPVLDGWRAVSILLVLSAHLLPLGPKALQLNYSAGAAGMALFFTLSGFLIVTALDRGMPLREFALKRIARIVPLAWLAIAVLATWQHYDDRVLLQNLLFVGNLPAFNLLSGGEHFWSLGVEMQFYACIGLTVALLGRRGLWLVPVGCLTVTAMRIAAGQPISIVTWHRVDEILAGGCLALAVARGHHRYLRGIPLWIGVIGLLVASNPLSGPVQYLRPYAAVFLVGISIHQPPKVLLTKTMAYIARVSFALYVIHGMLVDTWLGSGEKFVKLAKRPLLIALTFALAHLSTRYVEEPIMRRCRGKVPAERLPVLS